MWSGVSTRKTLPLESSMSNGSKGCAYLNDFTVSITAFLRIRCARIPGLPAPFACELFSGSRARTNPRPSRDPQLIKAHFFEKTARTGAAEDLSEEVLLLFAQFCRSSSTTLSFALDV